ncbi:hypothetical protein jhhlp_004810 [Lomentospora prolificans]|uniref:Uncharacterized protein n=1 Tax=Lomentospora prolificans TaxID=41688 RepID=A0A2N3N8N6_9PEZI|nr:hypothetical protein jhhlp_004810 [Lomentospora prolificans]
MSLPRFESRKVPVVAESQLDQEVVKKAGKHGPFCMSENHLFCARGHPSSDEKLQGHWLVKDAQISDFVDLCSAATGTGTLDPLGVKAQVLQEILEKLDFHRRVKDLVPALRGVFACFRAKGNGDSGHTTLHVIFCSPKSPVRELFCALRVRLSADGETVLSTRCLLFDNVVNNHSEDETVALADKECHLDRLMSSLHTDFHYGNPAWHHPLTILLTVIRQCTWSCSVRQETLNKYIISTERLTKTASWTNEPELSPWRSDFMQKIIKVQLYRTNLNIVGDSLDFQIRAWNSVLEWIGAGGTIQSDPPILDSPAALTGLLWNSMTERQKIEVLDDILFERSTTVRMKTQLDSLKDRYEAQSSLLDSLISQNDSQQSAVLSIIALIFAPTSIILSIFSLPFITYASEREWTIRLFIEVIVPSSILPVLVGYLYLMRHAIFTTVDGAVRSAMGFAGYADRGNERAGKLSAENRPKFWEKADS